MRVVMLGPFPPAPLAEADYARHVARGLAAAGHAVTVLASPPSTDGEDAGVQIRAVIPERSVRVLRVLRVELARARPEALITLFQSSRHHRNRFLGSPYFRLLAGVQTLRQVTIAHDAITAARWSRRPLALARQIGSSGLFTLGTADPLYGSLFEEGRPILAVSQRVAATIAAAYPNRALRVVIRPTPNMVPLSPPLAADERRAMRARLGAAEGDFLAAYFGFVYPGKGFEELIGAVARLHRSGTPVRLAVLARRGVLSWNLAYEAAMALRAAAPDFAGAVVWPELGPWESDGVSRLLRCADACVLPYDDGVCLHNSTVATAAAHGLPILTTRPSAGLAETEFRDERYVLLTAPRRADLLAERLAELERSPSLRAEYGRRAEALARESYDWGKVIATIEGLLA